jgi:hypothetical protein
MMSPSAVRRETMRRPKRYWPRPALDWTALPNGFYAATVLQLLGDTPEAGLVPRRGGRVILAEPGRRRHAANHGLKGIGSHRPCGSGFGGLPAPGPARGD